jgi:hypothetical protein
LSAGKKKMSLIISTFDFSLQLDETTDVSVPAVLLVNVCYFFENKIEEDYCSAKSPANRATREWIFNVINSYVIEHEISVLMCALMTAEQRQEKRQGRWRVSKSWRRFFSSSHCVLHRQALVAKTIERDLKTVFDEAVKIVHHIKFKPINAWVFKLRFEEMCSEHTALLLHTEIRCLCRGNFLLIC